MWFKMCLFERVSPISNNVPEENDDGHSPTETSAFFNANVKGGANLNINN